MKNFKIQNVLVFIFLITLVNCYGQKNVKSNKEQGPEWVKKVLIQDSVLSAPNYTLTNTYDEYKIHDNIQGLFFDGLLYKDKHTKVFCWYGVPSNLKEGEKAPAVVLVHGGGGTAFPQWVKKWTNEGYVAISIALEGQIPGEKVKKEGERDSYPLLPTSGPQRSGFFNDVEDNQLQNQWFYHAVADVILANSLLRSFPEVDTEKIGITGISWGGIITNVVTGIDDRFAFSIPVYGCGYLYETPLYSKLLSRIGNKAQDFYMTNWEPSLYVPYQKLPTLFVNGTNDKHFTMNSFMKTYETSTNDKHLYIKHEMPHGHGPGWTPKSIYGFADYVVKDGEKPLKIDYKHLKNKLLTFNYKGEVSESFLYYTTDPKSWDHDKYKWKEMPAQVNASNNTITVNLPKDATYIFLNTTSPNKLTYSSSMLKTDKL